MLEDWRSIMNKRQRKKLWNSIQKQEEKSAKVGIRMLGGSIMLGHGWIYNKEGNPVRLV